MKKQIGNSVLVSAIACGVFAGCAAPEAAATVAQAERECETQHECPEDEEEVESGLAHQPLPPPTWGTPDDFTYGDFTSIVDSKISDGLNAPMPPTDKPWPFAVPAMPNAPVGTQYLGGNRWVFTSFERESRSLQCVAECSTPPAFYFSATGWPRARMTLSPRLHIEVWGIGVQLGTPVPVPTLITKFTATPTLATTVTCVGWEDGSGERHGHVSLAGVTITRSTGIVEDIADFFDPGFTDAINRKLRAKVIANFGLEEPISLWNDDDPPPCATLDVSGGADITGAIRWNETPRPNPLTQTAPVGGGRR
jgi:hypothetical protein